MTTRGVWLTRCFCTIAIASVFIGPTRAQSPRPIEFNRDVRPILSDACFQCHGPDKQKRKAKLHFDTEEGARAAFVAGKPDESEMIHRITSSDKTKRMPPPSAAVNLTPKQIDVLKQWIKDGAKWQKHWAFIPPERPTLPQVKNKAWANNPIDYFVLARLEAEGLQPSLEADAATLIRRLSLDLTGLPPTTGEVDVFVKAWDAAGAKRGEIYENLVDRLLASPRYGERMATPWLNAARYADTNGYQTDGERIMWRWRDWVIEAFNDNMPFDRFTIEQIAGDMLPKPTLEQRIATGFNRNHRGNSEGGVIPEEFAVEYVVDRVDTTSTVWLGLSAGCARCHDHKYDPLSQKEFYQLYAYFNNVPERGKAIKYGNSPPYIKSPTRAQQKSLLELQSALEDARAQFRRTEPILEKVQRAWETRAAADQEKFSWQFTRHQVAHLRLDELDPRAANAPKLHGRPKRIVDTTPAIQFDGESWLDAGDVADFGFFDSFSFSMWINPGDAKAGPILSRMADTDRADGYSIAVKDGKLHVHLVKRWLDDAIRIETVKPVKSNEWQHVFVSYDGSREAKGIKIFFDGEIAEIKINLDDLNQSFRNAEPLRIAAGGGVRFRGAIREIQVFNDVVAPADVAILADRQSIDGIIRTSPQDRSAAQKHKLRTFFLERRAPKHVATLYRDMLEAEKKLERFDASLPTTMIMEEMPTPRDAFILLRGEYDKPGAKVGRAVPAAFPSLPKDAPNNRLGLAQWLVARDNPLTARVAVNRYWQMLFGAGIVRSVEDFGAQGDWPSHPDLLDWLAVEFMQPTASRARKRPQLLQRDPDNRLLARGPRVRLPADIIRDQALFASGLLVEKLGGPSVRPYQPTGLVMELTGTEEYEQDKGEKLYRRSLYTFWKRTIPPPAMMNLDAANRETCVVRESRTNTPLQALNLMNDVTFVEAARVLAERVMQLEKTPETRLALAWRLAATRSPSPLEMKIIAASLDRHHAHYSANREAALKLIATGESPRNQKLNVAEHAAYTAVCNLILNLDEVITKE